MTPIHRDRKAKHFLKKSFWYCNFIHFHKMNMKHTKPFISFAQNKIMCDATLLFVFAFFTIKAYENTQMLPTETIKKHNNMAV